MNRSLTRIFASAALAFAMAAPAAWAGGGAGSTTANFLKIGMGARAAGMGDAFMAVADDSLSVYWNPAGMMLLRGTDISLTHAEWMEGVKHEFLTFATRRKNEGAMGFSLTYLGVTPYASTLETPTGEYAGTGEDVSARDLAFSLAFAQRLGFWFPGKTMNKLMVGLKGNLVNQHLDDGGSTGLSFDLGGLYEIRRGRTYAALTVSNVGSRMSGRSQPLAVTVGASHKLRKLAMKKDSLVIAIAAPYYNDTSFRFNIGAEYVARFGQTDAALRAGYRTGYDLNGTAGVCVGMGFVRHQPTFDLGLDYALAPYGELGLTHRVTLKARFGGALVGPAPSVESPTLFTPASEPLTLKLNHSSEEAIAGWKTSISDMQGRPVTIFQGKGEPPSKLVWNGNRGDGTPAPKGDYRVDYRLEDDLDQVGWAKPRVFQLERVRVAPKTKYQYGFSFSGDLLFDSGRSELKPAGYEAITKAVEVIRQRYPEANIMITAFKNNDELSLARATAVRDHLVRTGFPMEKLAVQGFGETKPIAPNTTSEGRAKNRRVDLTLTGERTLTIDELLAEVANLMKNGQYNAALIELDKAMYLEVDNATVYKLMGNCYWRMGQKDKAMPCFRRAVTLDPADTALATWLAGQGGGTTAAPTPVSGLPALPQ